MTPQGIHAPAKGAKETRTMATLNRCDFIGNLGSDPESRYTPGGTCVTKCSIACNDKWKDKESGEMKEHTEWVNLEFWGRLGEIAAEYLKKGSPVYVSGQLRTDRYTPKDGGPEKFFTKVRVRDMQLLSAREGGRPAAQPKDYADAKGKDYSPPPAAAPPQADFDDDIPF
jgi:single-strand DNA-binding protein